ncbi:MAG: hypothetical protein V2A79_01165 [Planctomycetota bacterium]
MDWKRKISLLSALVLCTSVVVAYSAAGSDGGEPRIESTTATVYSDAAAYAESKGVGQLTVRPRVTEEPPAGEGAAEWLTDESTRASGVVYDDATLQLMTTPPAPTGLMHNGEVMWSKTAPQEQPKQTDPGEGLRQGGENCAGAVTIGPALPITVTGTTIGYAHNYAWDCGSGTDTSPDVVYKLVPTTSATVKITTVCESTITNFDSKIMVYESPTGVPGDCTGEPYACDDDFCSDDYLPSPWHSSIEFLYLTAGRTYYIVVDGWGAASSGNYELDISVVPPGACCDLNEACTDGTSVVDCIGLGDRFWQGELCAAHTPCPDPPVGPGCTGLMFGPGWGGFELVPPGNWGSPFAQFADAGGGIDAIIAEGFWNLPDAINAVTFWGFEILFNESAGAYVDGCEKADKFTITLYNDNNGEPDLSVPVAGPFLVDATKESSGWEITFTPPVGLPYSSTIYQYTAVLPEMICLSTGWISIQGQDDSLNPDCYFWWLTTDLSKFPPGTGQDDNMYWDDGAVMVGGGGMMLCISGQAGVTGACCVRNGYNDYTCTPDVACADCPTGRFAADLACDSMTPLCGEGACCYDYPASPNCQLPQDSCCAVTEEPACLGAPGGSWTDGVSCAVGPHLPQGKHCPPINDVCTEINTNSIPTIPANSNGVFEGRNDGATEDPECASLGPVVWEAFKTTSCQDLTIDYCDTDPVFLNAYLILLPACCDTDNGLSAASFSTSAREGGCCLDDPPGYDQNVLITFDNVPGGTWYYPVLSEAGSRGLYTIHVYTSSCTIGDPAEEDCNGNGKHDIVDIETNGSADCNSNWIPDECECDINGDGFGGREDYKQFQICMDTWNEANCACILDHNVNGKIDLNDFWWFQQCFDGCIHCPDGTYVENGDPTCGVPTDTNGGCLMAVPAFETILVSGQTVCGTFGSTSSARDTDWYQVDLTTTTKITWSVTAEFPAEAWIFDGSAGCTTTGTRSYNTQGCTAVSVTECLPAGTHYVAVLPMFASDLDGSMVAPCPTHYKAQLTTAPCALGRCCNDGTCTPNISILDCESDPDAVFTTNGGTCSPNPCPTAVLNDECSGAIDFGNAETSKTVDLGGASYNGTPYGTPPAPTDPDFSCAWDINNPQGENTVWYRFTATTTSALIQTCNSSTTPPAVNDTIVALYTGKCPTGFVLTELACGEDECPVDGQGEPMTPWLSKISYANLTVGAVYRIQLANAYNGRPGSVILELTRPSPEDPCSPSPCPGTGTPEGEVGPDQGLPLYACNAYAPGVYRDTFNAGCNVELPGATFNFSPIACGDDVCGRSGLFSTNGLMTALDIRDTDWYKFSLTERNVVSWTIDSGPDAAYSDHHGKGAQALLIDLNRGANLEDACTNSLVVASAANFDQDPTTSTWFLTGCGTITATATLDAGAYAAHATFGPRPADAQIGTWCGTLYRGQLDCTRAADMLAAPTDSCLGAPDITANGTINTNGYWSGWMDDVLYPGARIKIPAPCGLLGNADDVDVWFKYVAPCTGRVNFRTCGATVNGDTNGNSTAKQIVAVYTGTCPGGLSQVDPQSSDPPYPCSTGCGGGFSGGSGSCGTDCFSTVFGEDKKQGTVTIDVIQGTTYWVQILTDAVAGCPGACEWGLHTVDVSECVVPCP